MQVCSHYIRTSFMIIIIHMFHVMKYWCQIHIKKYAKFTCKLHGLRIKSKLMQIILVTIVCILSCWAHFRIIGDSKHLKILKR